jgi:ectoine hydroxylase-related dioxygenase (phytanoyl-CoA dioxygenase family)
MKKIDAIVKTFKRDGFYILRSHFSADLLRKWNQEFQNLLKDHIEREGHIRNRGANRYYVTLPFQDLWADKKIYEDPVILEICERLVGSDMVMCQLATDTPLLDSEYQEIHRDALPLFPETDQETPTFQLAINFPLVPVTEKNGPFEVARGTHMMNKKEGLKFLESGDIKLEPVLMNLGDVMIRDVRGLHRGTPNRTAEPRPMVVIGYSRKWLFRPEVSIQIPRHEYAKLSERGKQLLRFNPVVESLEQGLKTEIYQSFAY